MTLSGKVSFSLFCNKTKLYGAEHIGYFRCIPSYIYVPFKKRGSYHGNIDAWFTDWFMNVIVAIRADKNVGQISHGDIVVS